jgi:hypothetical protein
MGLLRQLDPMDLLRQDCPEILGFPVFLEDQMDQLDPMDP